MLNSGEVPNIFVADEKAELCEKMRVVSNIIFILNLNMEIEKLVNLNVLICKIKESVFDKLYDLCTPQLFLKS